MINNDSNNNIDLDNMALQVGERLGQAPALPGIPVDTAHVALGFDLLFSDVIIMMMKISCEDDDNFAAQVGGVGNSAFCRSNDGKPSQLLSHSVPLHG